MKKEMRDNTLAAAIHEVEAILKERWGDMTKCCDEAQRDHEQSGAETSFKYRINLSVNLKPSGPDSIQVSASIRYGFAYADETAGITVDNQMRLDFREVAEE